MFGMNEYFNIIYNSNVVTRNFKNGVWKDGSNYHLKNRICKYRSTKNKNVGHVCLHLQHALK